MMFDMIGDDQRLGLFQRRDHRLHLLRDLEAVIALLDHLDDSGEMAVRAAQPVEQIGVGSVAHDRSSRMRQGQPTLP